MAKTARKASSKSASRKTSSTVPSKMSNKASAYWRVREKIEGLYFLHLFLLVVMSSLGAALFVISVNQRIKIQNLEFQLDFVTQRYEILRQAEQDRRMDEELEASPSPVMRPVESAR